MDDVGVLAEGKYSKRLCQMLAHSRTACLHPSPMIYSALHHSYGQLHPLLLYHLTPNAFTNLAPKNNSMLLVNSVVMACKPVFALKPLI